MSSGTLGAAMEGNLCGFKAIGVSFHYFTPNTDSAIVAEACRHVVRVVENLAARTDWVANKCYSLNVPLEQGSKKEEVHWCRLKDVQWVRGPTVFQEVGPVAGVKTTDAPGPVRSFEWNPDMSPGLNIRAQPQEEGTDAWAVAQGYSSLVSLDATFRHVESLRGRLIL